jgi:hypothetical protein
MRTMLKTITLLIQLFCFLRGKIVIWLEKVSHIVMIVRFLFAYLLLYYILNVPKHIVIMNIWRTEFG